MKSSYVYSPLPKKLLENPEETYYNPFKEIKIFNRDTRAICICKYISFVDYSFDGGEGYISFYDYSGNEIVVKAHKKEEACDAFFKYLEKIENGQIVCEYEEED